MTTTATERRENLHNALDAAAPESPALAGLDITAPASEWLAKLLAVGVPIKRPPLPVLSMIRISCQRRRATLTGYDFQTSVVATLQHDTSKRLPTADLLVPHSWLLRTIRTLTSRDRKAPVTVASSVLLGQTLVTVTAAGYTIPWLGKIALSEFPPTPQCGELGSFTLPTSDLAKPLARATVAASPDDSLPILTSIRIEGSGKHVDLLSTDRYRLGYERISLKREIPEFGFLLSATLWKAVARHLHGENTTVRILTPLSGGDIALAVTSGDVTFTLQGIAGDYPKIRSLFPETLDREIDVDRAALLDQVIIAKELNARNTPGHLHVTGDSVTFRPSFDEASDQVASPLLAASAPVRAVWTDAIVLGFNPHYLADALRVITTKTVRFGFNKDQAGKFSRPACLSAAPGKDEKPSTYRHLVMPVRMPETL